MNFIHIKYLINILVLFVVSFFIPQMQMILPAESAIPLIPTLELNYYSYNNESKNVIVLIHGMQSSAKTFDRVVPFLLSKNFRVITFDLRGHGKSVAQGTDYSLSTLSEDLFALLGYLKIKKVHLLGHSFGARVALKFFELHSDHIESLVIEDMEAIGRPVITEEAHLLLLEKHKKIPKNFATKSLAISKLSTIYGKRKAENILETKSIYLSDGTIKLTFDPTVALLFGYAAASEDLSEALKLIHAIHLPFLILKSTFSQAISTAGIQHFLKFSPNVKIIEITDAAHNIHKTQLQHFLGALFEFYSNL